MSLAIRIATSDHSSTKMATKKAALKHSRAAFNIIANYFTASTA